MKKYLLLFLLLVSCMAQAQQTQNRVFYDEKADQMVQIDEAVQKAKAEGKYIICQVGGNWCKWCRWFGQFVEDDEEIAGIIADNYVYLHVNYVGKNDEKTQKVITRLKNPGRFGFPVLVILDSDGNVIHTQATEYLEEGQGYNKDRVVKFLKLWTPTAVNTVVR